MERSGSGKNPALLCEPYVGGLLLTLKEQSSEKSISCVNIFNSNVQCTTFAMLALCTCKTETVIKSKNKTGTKSCDTVPLSLNSTVITEVI